jgi:hypothetical protein
VEGGLARRDFAGKVLDAVDGRKYARAIIKPIPREPPVTTATFPRIENRSSRMPMSPPGRNADLTDRP